MRIVCLLAAITGACRHAPAAPAVGGVAAAPADAAPTPWPTWCAAELDAASAELGRADPAFREPRATVIVPRALPAAAPRAGVLPLPPSTQHAPQVSWDLQLLEVPEYFYVDVASVEDERGRAWAAVAGDGAWACHDRVSDDQHDVDCVQRLGDRLAVVRAIYWGRSGRLGGYLRAFTAATDACLVRAADAEGR